MARGLGMEREAFVRRYCRLLDGKIALREVRRFDPASHRIEHDCIFLQNGKSCAVYDTRPVQCRTFPFWPEALASPEAWQQLRQRGCEGLDQTGEWISAETIASELARTLDAPGFPLPGER
jgi:Fe-S-cluster containining protein